jgi:hypothetical protein
VVATAGGIRISGGDTSFTQRLIGNVAYAAEPVSGPKQQDNVTGRYADAAGTLAAPYATIGTLSLYPKSGQLGGAPVDVSTFSSFEDGLKDFNGSARTGVKRGAYEGEDVNLGWRVALATKGPLECRNQRWNAM